MCRIADSMYGWRDTRELLATVQKSQNAIHLKFRYTQQVYWESDTIVYIYSKTSEEMQAITNVLCPPNKLTYKNPEQQNKNTASAF